LKTPLPITDPVEIPLFEVLASERQSIPSSLFPALCHTSAKNHTGTLMEPENDRARKKLNVEDDDADTDDESEMLKVSRNELEKFVQSAFEEAKENDSMDELWEEMPTSWKNDPEIVLGVSKIGCIAALEAPCLLFSNWQEVPTRLQNDLDFAKHFLLSRPYYDEDYPYQEETTSQVFLAHPGLRSDLDFWMRTVCDDNLCYGLLDSLWHEFAAESVKSNKAILLKVCLHNWCLTEYVGASLWRDRDFVETVLKSDPRVLLDLPAESQRLFPDLVLRTIEGCAQHPEMYHNFEADDALILAEMIPPDAWNDRKIVKMWIKLGLPIVEEVFPDAWKDDREIVLLITSHCINYYDYIDDALDKFDSYTSPALRGDRDFMLSVCRHDNHFFNCASAALQRDKVFIQEALRQDSRVLEYLPHVSQCLFPDLVRQAFRPLGQHRPEFEFFDCNEFANNIAPEIWTDRNAVIAWFEAGLPFYADVFPDAWTFDREIFLLIARHCQHDIDIGHVKYSFDQAALSLRSDKEFMVTAMAEYAPLFFCASPELQRDFDLILLVCSSSQEAAERFARSVREVGEPELVAQVHDALMHSIIFSMDQTANSSCAFCLLDQGPDTWLAITVAEFLGVPVGKERHLLRCASENLLNCRP
jgi:Domain of unknown function (DUF4116)